MTSNAADQERQTGEPNAPRNNMETLIELAQAAVLSFIGECKISSSRPQRHFPPRDRNGSRGLARGPARSARAGATSQTPLRLAQSTRTYARVARRRADFSRSRPCAPRCRGAGRACRPHRRRRHDRARHRALGRKFRQNAAAAKGEARPLDADTLAFQDKLALALGANSHDSPYRRRERRHSHRLPEFRPAGRFLPPPLPPGALARAKPGRPDRFRP